MNRKIRVIELAQEIRDTLENIGIPKEAEVIQKLNQIIDLV